MRSGNRLDLWHGDLARAAAVAGGCAAVLVVSGRPLTGPGVVQQALILSLATMALGLMALGWLRGWRPSLAVSHVVVLGAGALFLTLALSSVVFGAHPWRSLVGQPGRGTGWLLYLGSYGLFVVVALTFLDRWRERLLLALAGLGLITALLGLVQFAGLNPFGLNGEWNRTVVGTLLNPNFASGFLAIAFPAVLYVGLVARGHLRLAASATALLLLLGLVGARSVQGVVALFVAVLVFTAATATTWSPPRRAKAIASLAAGLGLAGLGLVAAGVTGAGSLGALALRAGVRQRGYYWDAAWTMFERNPLLGVGFDGFGTYYRGLRDVADATGAALFQVADAAHSVPLGMLAGGGLLTASAYMTFVALVGAVGVWSVVKSQGSSRLLNAAVLSGWAAYQVQSLVSIDVPALAVWHWLLAGAVVAGIPLDRVAHRESAQSAEPGTKRKGGVPRRAGRRSPRKLRPVPAAIAAVLTLAALWLATWPARWDLAAGAAYRSAIGGDPAGLTELERVASAVPWEPEYWESLGRASAALGDQPAALAAFEEAASRDPGGLSPVLNAARAAVATGQDALAAHYYRLALSRDPHSPELSFEFGQFMANEDPQAAIDHVERAVSARPETTAWWVYLGKLLVLAGNDQEAIAAAQAAYELDPETYGVNADVVRILIQAGAPQAALEVLEPLLARAEDANLLTLAGVAHETLGEPERAEERYRRALTYDGDFPEAVQGLARLGETP